MLLHRSDLNISENFLSLTVVDGCFHFSIFVLLFPVFPTSLKRPREKKQLQTFHPHSEFGAVQTARVFFHVGFQRYKLPNVCESIQILKISPRVFFRADASMKSEKREKEFSNEYILAKIGFDTAENELLKV